MQKFLIEKVKKMFETLNLDDKVNEEEISTEIKKLLTRIDMKKLEMRYKRNG